MASKTDNRKAKRNSRDQRSGTPKFALAVSPLSTFLQNMDDEGESRLASLAAAAAKEPFDVAKFRQQLIGKLKRVRYTKKKKKETGKRFGTAY